MNDDSKAMEAAARAVMLQIVMDAESAREASQAAVRAYLAQIESDGSVVISVEWLEAVLAYANPIGVMGDHVFAEIRAMIAARPNP
jgi:hypothetical protein